MAEVTMRKTVRIGVFMMMLVTVAACASVPPSRIGEYLGAQAEETPSAEPALPPRPVRAGLVVVSDTMAPGAAPAVPDEALVQLTESLQQQFNSALPIIIERIVTPEGIGPGGSSAQLSELGMKFGLNYLVFVVASSTEQEYPLTIFLGWTTHSQPGLRRDNWSLMEVALIDVNSGQPLVQAEGRGWATLDRPTAPGINQWYPVIWLRPQDPARRIWPPTYEGAPNTLRVVAMNEAAKRLVLNFQEAWIQKRETELKTTQG